MNSLGSHWMVHFSTPHGVHCKNNSLDAEWDNELLTCPRDVEITIFVLKCVFVLLGLPGNALVVIVVAMKKDMRTVCNILVANLAVRDIVFLSVVGVTDFVFHALQWAGENCNHTRHDISLLIVYLLTVSIMTMSGFLVALALDRYRSIGQPMTSRTKGSVRNAMISSGLIWLASLLLCITQPALDVPHNQLSWLIAVVILTFIGYVIPLAVVIGCYIAIYVAVHRQESGEWNHLTRWDFRRKIRVLRMVAYVVIVFSVAWGYWFATCIYVAIQTAKNVTLTCDDQILLGVGDLAVFAASAVNPFIYGITNSNFNRHFKAILSRSFSPRSLHNIAIPRETTATATTTTVPSNINVLRNSIIMMDIAESVA